MAVSTRDLKFSIERIHPVIRISCLLLVGMFSMSAEPQMLVLTAALLGAGFGLGQWPRLYQTGRVLWRLKWLFLSILLIYLFLTPGKALVGSLYVSSLGLELGLLRIAALTLFIAAVNLLIRSASQSELTYALLWLLRPLQRLHIPVTLFAIRLALTLEYVGKLHAEVHRQKQEAASAAVPLVSGGVLDRSRYYLRSAADRAGGLFQRVLEMAAEHSPRELEQPDQTDPSLAQWILPLLLFCLYSMVNMLSHNG